MLLPSKVENMQLKVNDAAKTRDIASLRAQADQEKSAKDKEITALKQENAELKARMDHIEKMLKSK